MKYEHMSWAAHLYPLTSPFHSVPHHPNQALETIFVEEAFLETFNEKSFSISTAYTEL